MKNTLLITLCLLFSTTLIAQEQSATTSPIEELFINKISSQLVEQIKVYPQEKLYVHTDKPHYISGEKIWFRIHLVDAVFNKQANASRYAYVDLINPLGEVENRVKIRPDSTGLFYGHLSLEENLIEGQYSIRAYTEFMKNIGDDYLYKQAVYISNPKLLKIDATTEFTYKNNEEVKASIKIIDNSKKEIIKPDKINLEFSDKRVRELHPSADFISSISFRFPREDKFRTVLLNFEVNGLKYKKYIVVPYPEDDFDLSFFPEGGHYLTGTPIKVAFKAMKPNGLSEQLTGKLINNEGTVLQEFKTNSFGMGIFTSFIEEGKTYYVVGTNADGVTKKFNLPIEQTAHYSLSANWRKDQIYLSVNKSASYQENDSLYLLIHSRGIPLYNMPWNSKVSFLPINSNTLPYGISNIILYDKDKNIVSERLLFNSDNTQLAKTTLTTNKNRFDRREEVRAIAHITTQDEQPLSGNFSVSVIDNNDIKLNNSNNIVSYLLLSSDLKGYIESPAAYLTKDDRTNKLNLDYLMLTQGWRRYNMEKVIKGEYETPTIEPELSQTLSGRIQGKLFSSGKNGQVKLIGIKDNFVDFQLTEANNTGFFTFKDFEFPDSTLIVVEALTGKGNDKVILDLFPDKLAPEIETLPPLRKKEDHAIDNSYIKKADQQYVLEHGMRLIDLDELVVTAKKKEATRSRYYSPVTGGEILDEESFKKFGINNMSSLLIHLGIYVTNGKPQIRNQDAQIIIDDIVRDYDGFDLDLLVFEDIESAFIIKDGFGVANMKPSIVFTMKEGRFIKSPPADNIKNIQPLGYQQTVEFYSPHYDSHEAYKSSTPDLRTTIYWKPDVRIETKGDAYFDFYTADTPTTYSIIIEGVSDEGFIIYNVSELVRD